MSLTRQVVSSLKWTVGMRMLAQAVTWCSTLIVMRLLSPDDYGLMAMACFAVAFLGLVAELGLGAALMQSDRLELRGNRIQQHREGSAAYGVLLKDIGDLVAEDNIIITNRVGIYAEGVPSQPAREAIVRRNVIAGNEVGLALQSNAALSVAENRIADNLTDVRALGGRLSASSRWSIERRGNAWSQYRGYDADRDGEKRQHERLDDETDQTRRDSCPPRIEFRESGQRLGEDVGLVGPAEHLSHRSGNRSR